MLTPALGKNRVSLVDFGFWHFAHAHAACHDRISTIRAMLETWVLTLQFGYGHFRWEIASYFFLYSVRNSPTIHFFVLSDQLGSLTRFASLCRGIFVHMMRQVSGYMLWLNGENERRELGRRPLTTQRPNKRKWTTMPTAAATAAVMAATVVPPSSAGIGDVYNVARQKKAGTNRFMFCFTSPFGWWDFVIIVGSSNHSFRIICDSLS